MTVVLFLIILGALVFVHELGHFISAKRAGIRVDEFALGFPPTLLSKQIGETKYSLNLIPFGGYVKIFGEDGTDANERGLEMQIDADGKSPLVKGVAHSDATGVVSSDHGRRFTAKPRYIQAVVLASGVLGNIIFAWLLISIGFLSGIPSSVEGRYSGEVQNPKLTITSVVAGSPAERAGLRAGDTVIAISDTTRLFKDTDADKAREFIAETKGSLSLEFGRGSETKSAEIQPVQGIVAGKPAIGVSIDTVGVVRFGIFRSLYEGLLTTWDLLHEVANGMLGFLQKVFTGKADLNSISGPVGIAGLVGEARVLGIVYLLSFTAFISINLAVINLLPIPALDGGRLLFLAIEGIIRRPIPAKFTKVVNTTGFILLLLFMAFITYRDIAKLL